MFTLIDAELIFFVMPTFQNTFSLEIFILKLCYKYISDYVYILATGVKACMALVMSLNKNITLFVPLFIFVSIYMSKVN